MDNQRNWTVAHYQVWAAWQEQVSKAVRRPWLLRALLDAETRARFFTVYAHLRALPRQTRRALQRRLAQSLAGVALVLALGQGQGLAATFNIPCPGGVGNNTALIQAITDANDEIANPGADTINLVAGCTHTLTTAIPSPYYGSNGLPLVTSTITIAGNGSTIERGAGAPDFRILAVSSGGNLTLQNLTLTGGSVVSNGGGGVSNSGILTLTNSIISGNTASGGGGGVSSNGILTLTNSIISGNTASNHSLGGGVSNVFGTVILTNSTISGNTAGAGGGVFNNGGPTTLVLINSAISGNTSTNGGGVFSGDVTLIDSTISGNTAGYSGGMLGHGDGIMAPSTLTLTDSTVSSNTASGRGGGMLNNSTLTSTNSTISDNMAANGGGVDNFNTMTLISNTISDNTASNSGGGVYNRSTLTLTNSTLSGNTAANNGGGIFNYYAFLTFMRTLVSGNTANNGQEVSHTSGGGSVTANNYNLFGHSGLTGAQAFMNFILGATDINATSDGATPTALDAILNTALADNGGPTQTHALVSGSPAVDASPADADCQPTDQRGVPRPQGAACDIGAFEVSLEVHDLAVTNLSVPKTVILTAAKPQQTKSVKVQLQNRSPHNETITTFAGLVNLTLEPLIPGMCAPTVSLRAKQTALPKVLNPKQKLSVNFDVIFDCALDPAKTTPQTPGHEDFRYKAKVDHAAIDGQPDTHLDDDSCPRAALGIDSNPDGKINDKGCAEEIADVVDKR